MWQILILIFCCFSFSSPFFVYLLLRVSHTCCVFSLFFHHNVARCVLFRLLRGLLNGSEAELSASAYPLLKSKQCCSFSLCVLCCAVLSFGSSFTRGFRGVCCSYLIHEGVHNGFLLDTYMANNALLAAEKEELKVTLTERMKVGAAVSCWSASVSRC